MSKSFGNIKRFDSDELVTLPTKYKALHREFRGIWVATVANIDISIQESVKEYKAKYLKILDNLEKYNMNAILFQIRPLNDAFYPSKLNPWSRYLVGEEGKNPGWDPLKWMIEETHKRGMEFHGWLNPYRVSVKAYETKKEDYLKELDDINFAKRNPHLVVSDTDNKMILNPGEPEVIEFIVNTIEEIISNYEIDGIHFDDYFYPYSPLKEGEDTKTYNKYKKPGESLFDWRIDNVDKAIYAISESIKNYEKKSDRVIHFGISPFSVWRSKVNDPNGSNTGANVFQCYDRQYADVRKWVKKNWIDYVVPQAYLEFSHATVPYADIVDWWVETVQGTKVNLYIGQANYKYGKNEAWENYMEVPNQLLYNGKHKEIEGSIMFSYISTLGEKTHIHSKKAMDYILKEYWNKSVKTPLKK